MYFYIEYYFSVTYYTQYAFKQSMINMKVYYKLKLKNIKYKKKLSNSSRQKKTKNY